jgi:hypothetical protein
VAARTCGQPGVELDRPRLLEQVDDGVGVRPKTQAGADIDQRRRGTDAVGQITLGRRAEADVRRRQCVDVAGGQVGWRARR